MRIADVEVASVSRGVQETTEFGIANSPKMFYVLSKSLYPDGIRAAIRELSTNAVDAHNREGTLDKPYDVHLPTRLEPWFAIRDYGTGMSLDTMNEVYPNYGVSDKCHSNVEIGGLGLGSKTPFAYTNSFSATSVYNGRKFIFICAMNSKGMPTINKMLDTETDEPNGLEVKFSVKDSDIDKFQQQAAAIYKYFEYQPNFTGASCMVTKPQYDKLGNGWGLHGGITNIVMGGIAYPIDINVFTKHEGHYWRVGGAGDAPEAILIKTGVDIFCEIGEVEIQPSREGLHYTEEGISLIKSKLEDVLIDIDRSVTESIVDAKTLWEAKLMYRRMLLSKYQSLSEILAARNLTWNGQSLQQEVTFEDMSFVKFTKYHGRVAPRRSTTWSVVCSETGVFIEDDLKRGAYTLCNRLIKDGKYTTVYLLNFKDDAERIRFNEVVGNPPILLASSFPKGPRNVGSSVKRDDVYIFDKARTGRRTIRGSEYWVDAQADLDMDDGGQFVGISSYRFNGNQETHVLAELLKTMEALGLTIPTIYGVKKHILDKFEGHDDWMNFSEYAKLELETYIATNNIAEHYANLMMLRRNRDNISLYVALAKNSEVAPTPGGDLSELINKIDELKRSNVYKNKIELIESLTSSLSISLAYTCKYDIAAEISKVKEKYPILAFIDNCEYSNVKSTVVVSYLNKENENE